MIFDNMVNDNDLSSLRKDKQYQALLAAVKDRQPLSVLKKSAPYGRDAMKMENPSKALVVIDIQNDITMHYRDIVDKDRDRKSVV